MSTIYRANHSNLWLTLQASEELGLLVGDYLEDYFGNLGQVSLYHIPSDTYFPVVMIEVPESTPEIPHDVFKGVVAISGVPDGAYEIRGRVKDVMGNYSIISSVQTPYGGERVVSIGFTIKPGRGLIYEVSIGGALVRAGLQGCPIARDFLVGPAIAWPDLVA